MTIHSTSRDAQRTASIAQIVTATAEVLGQEITATAAEMIATDLAEYPDQQIADGLKACRRELTGRLTLAAIIDRIQRTDGHPEPSEAWAIALQASDESRTVVMTEQIQKALHAAQSILDSGDAIGARMAFIDAYRRLVDAARQSRQSPLWQVSLGWDAQSRKEAINRAVQAGYITSAKANVLLLQCESWQGEPTGNAIAGLITGKNSDAQINDDKARRKIAELREFIKLNNKKIHEEREQRRKAQAADLVARREAAAHALEELQAVREA